MAIAQKLISNLDEHGSDRAAFLRLRAVIHSDAGELNAALSDMKESLALSPRDLNSLQLDGDVLMKLGRTSEAIAVFLNILKIDPHSRFALTSLGYASRAAGNSADAERILRSLGKRVPLVLRSISCSRRYVRGQSRVYAGRGCRILARVLVGSLWQAMIVAGGMNAAIESHDLPLAGIWQQRVSEKMVLVSQVLREEERYFSFMGDSQRSADLGRQAIKLIPHDREVVVYLGYDLLRLEQYDELLALMTAYGYIA